MTRANLPAVCLCLGLLAARGGAASVVFDFDSAPDRKSVV